MFWSMLANREALDIREVRVNSTSQHNTFMVAVVSFLTEEQREGLKTSEIVTSSPFRTATVVVHYRSHIFLK